MNYSVNPAVFKSIFAVPAEIVDKHIRLANGDQLKVLLWILRNSPDNPDINEMCKALKITQSDAEDYLQYWVLTGVLNGGNINKTSESGSDPQVTQKAATESVKEEKAEITVIPSKPSSSEIAVRLDESPEIGHLFNEAQSKLGRTIGYDGQCTLLLIHDHYGLPTEVIFMLIDYCVSINKTNNGYIEAVGKDWGKREIDTLDKAAEQIAVLRSTNVLWSQFAAAAGISNPRPTMNQTEHLRRWGNEFKYDIDVIMLAYEEMANHTSKLSMNYINKVLQTWYEKGLKTADDVIKAKDDAKKAAKPSANVKPGNSNAASYDLDEFKERSLHSELKYERKKK